MSANHSFLQSRGAKRPIDVSHLEPLTFDYSGVDILNNTLIAMIISVQYVIACNVILNE